MRGGKRVNAKEASRQGRFKKQLIRNITSETCKSNAIRKTFSGMRSRYVLSGEWSDFSEKMSGFILKRHMFSNQTGDQ